MHAPMTEEEAGRHPVEAEDLNRKEKRLPTTEEAHFKSSVLLYRRLTSNEIGDSRVSTSTVARWTLPAFLNPAVGASGYTAGLGGIVEQYRTEAPMSGYLLPKSLYTSLLVGILVASRCDLLPCALASLSDGYPVWC